MIEIGRRAILTAGATAALPGALRSAVRPLEAHHRTRIVDLIARMTLDEKVGQLTQLAGGRQKALNSRIDTAALEAVRRGAVGSYLHVAGAAPLQALQKVAVEESRLGIPLLFAADVVHGFRTIAPVPLALAASWDPGLAKAAARMAAVEAEAAGLHWTFAPMVDIARDPRWGRVVEGAGEDPFLGAAMARAQVAGFQDGAASVLACAKHFGAYGAAAGGRDYDSADVSERTLHETYLPPFHAAMQAGAATMMVAFNDLGGVPSTANAELLRHLLRERWGYQGLVISDWNAVQELMAHGVAATPAQAATLALRASIDMDMASGTYAAGLAEAVGTDASLLPLLDEAVGRVLAAKARAGLFDAPLAIGSAARERRLPLSPAHRRVARAAARASIVLLRNDGDVLPLRPNTRVSLGGPRADDASSLLGSWRAQGRPEETLSLRQALSASGARLVDSVAADVLLLAIGEDFDASGEARSRTDIALSVDQQALLAEARATGKPVLVILMNGRPLALEAVLDGIPAVVETWFLGTEGAAAIADVLWGRASPAGRLPIGLPRTSGQVPASYAHLPTGRPADANLAKDTARYRDVEVGPLFPFGHGLSYTRFDYSTLSLDRGTISPDGSVRVSVSVTNRGSRDGEEVVQLYLRDPLAAVARPVLELRGFAQVPIAAGVTRRVTFTITAGHVAFWSREGWRIEAGQVEVMVGASSADIRARASFTISANGHAHRPAAAVPTPVEIG
jgi:beta-glucosidase